MIVIAARRSGARTLADSAAPTAIANTIYEAGHATYRYLIGDINADEYREEAGGAVIRGTAAFYCGMAGQLLIPIPVAGALVGATVGYITSAALVESGILGVGPSNIVAIESRRRAEVERSCRAACARLEAYEREITQIIASDQAFRESTIVPALTSFDQAVASEDFDHATAALGSLNLALGRTLPFRTLDEFDEFMLDDDSALYL